jgi:phage-related minor tail protein
MRGKVDDLIKELEGLRIQQAQSLVRQQEILTELRQEVLQEAEETSPSRDYEAGERVHITTTSNSRPHGTAATERDRTATVTRVTPSRIYVRTDNGFHTWRARGNVTPLPLVHF